MPVECHCVAVKNGHVRKVGGVLAQDRQQVVVDLDGPLLLAKDRPGGLRYEGSEVSPPEPVLWG